MTWISAPAAKCLDASLLPTSASFWCSHVIQFTARAPDCIACSYSANCCRSAQLQQRVQLLQQILWYIDGMGHDHMTISIVAVRTLRDQSVSDTRLQSHLNSDEAASGSLARRDSLHRQK